MPEPAFSHEPLMGESSSYSRAPVARPAPPTSLSPPVRLRPGLDAGRTTVAVWGELDLDAAQRLRSELYGALSHAPQGLDLDLREVDFCDCSGLNLLLGLRHQAVEQGKTVRIARSSPALERVIDLTGTRHLLAPTEPTGGGADAACPVVHEAAPADDAEQDLRTVVTQLRRAMQTRPIIDLARGILMSSFYLSPEAAWDVLVTASQNTNTKLHVLAGDVVATVQGCALSDTVRKQLEAAVAKSNARGSGLPAMAQPDFAVTAVDPGAPPDSIA
ncbi:ANTAR domain-containing protein [Streptomyces sp. NPDC005863]|uniref:ANTAR domain-containing protein n=1 Tax=unclassified Streptomyces TaxID=2593676 RepID=UPI00340FAFED